MLPCLFGLFHSSKCAHVCKLAPSRHVAINVHLRLHPINANRVRACGAFHRGRLCSNNGCYLRCVLRPTTTRAISNVVIEDRVTNGPRRTSIVTARFFCTATKVSVARVDVSRGLGRRTEIMYEATLKEVPTMGFFGICLFGSAIGGPSQVILKGGVTWAQEWGRVVIKYVAFGRCL